MCPGFARTDGIGDKVRDTINQCQVVIANVWQYPGENEAGYNPNVWYEIGYAWKADKPVIFFRHINNRLTWPSDIGERVPNMVRPCRPGFAVILWTRRPCKHRYSRRL
jgi:nucleoside 2-deoxyribosyltransferase